MDHNYSHARILIVDDQLANTTLLESFLKANGYTNYVTTNDAREVAQLVRETIPDLILLDIMMPVMDGFECLAELEKMDPTITHELNVFMLSSSIDRNVISKAEKFAIVKRVLEKPLDVYLLKMALEDIFSE